MKKSDDFILNEVAGTYVLIPINSQNVNFSGIITINETAKFIWDNIKEDFDTPDIIDLIRTSYLDVSEEMAKESAEIFVNELRGVGAIV